MAKKSVRHKNLVQALADAVRQRSGLLWLARAVCARLRLEAGWKHRQEAASPAKIVGIRLFAVRVGASGLAARSQTQASALALLCLRRFGPRLCFLVSDIRVGRGSVLHVGGRQVNTVPAVSDSRTLLTLARTRAGEIKSQPRRRRTPCTTRAGIIILLTVTPVHTVCTGPEAPAKSKRSADRPGTNCTGRAVKVS
eukprot:1459247-Rhodomonas_salina.1